MRRADIRNDTETTRARRWRHARYAFYVLTSIALLAWGCWMDFTTPGNFWRWGYLTSVASNPTGHPENIEPLRAFLFSALAAVSLIVAILGYMAKRGWEVGGYWAACMLCAVPLAVALITHNVL